MLTWHGWNWGGLCADLAWMELGWESWLTVRQEGGIYLEVCLISLLDPLLSVNERPGFCACEVTIN